MRVTFVLPTVDYSGGTRVCATYAQRLVQRGHEVVCISVSNRPEPFRRRVKNYLRGGGWPRIPAQHASHFDGLDVNLRIVHPWRPIVDSDVPDADVVLATWWETAHWVSALSNSKGAKAYLVQHHELLFPWTNPQRVAASYRLPMHKIVISSWLADIMRDEYGEKDLSLVPNSVDLALFNAAPRAKQAQPTVGFMYSTSHLKGVDLTIRAIRQLQQALPDLRVIAFGMAAEPHDLPSQTHYVRRPEQSKLRDLYATCDAWLCGSRAEGFGLPILEAMACRTPVVATRTGAAEDVIRPGINGEIVDVGDVAGLSAAASRILNYSEARWLAVSDAAHATACGYTWDDATVRLETALQHAMHGQTAMQKDPLRRRLAAIAGVVA
jgi:glycosyltransferase involved in cell wall biosynthesis